MNRIVQRRTVIFDAILLFTSMALAIVAASAVVVSPGPSWLSAASLAGLTLIAIGSVIARWLGRPDHLRALQSHHMLAIANESLGHLRQGLTEESAGAVCRITLERTGAAAVAISDTELVLGFSGLGDDHHVAGDVVATPGMREAISLNVRRTLETSSDIGCPHDGCLLDAAIVAPLEVSGRPVGALTFYYTHRLLLNETQVAMAEGLARLFSTQLELSELERQTELAYRMELKALQAQIHPHFLFNTINTIAMLIRTDPEKARTLLRDFARFYRRTLEATEDLVPLEHELEYVRIYLSFERARFGDRITLVERIDSEIRDLLVPAFTIQPLVENSVQHGLRTNASLTITVSGMRMGGRIMIEVSDDGVGIPADEIGRVLAPGSGKGLGIALRNVDDRLRGHYGPGSGLHVSSVEHVGTNATLTIVTEP